MKESGPLRIVFFGTSWESLPALHALAEDSRVRLLGVVTQPPRPVGRKQAVVPSAVQEYANARQIPCWAPHKLSELHGMMDTDIDVFVVVSFGRILPATVLAQATHTVNVHPSLLPKHRGPIPVPATILSGDEETGVTIMLMDEQMDHGPLLKTIGQVPVDHKTAQELLQELMDLGAHTLVDTICALVSGELSPVEQIHEQATYCSLLSREDAHIDWSRGEVFVERMVRAYTPWPGTWTEVEERPGLWRRMKLLATRLEPLTASDAGWMTTDGVTTRIGELVIERFQFAGKTPMTGAEFARVQGQSSRRVR